MPASAQSVADVVRLDVARDHRHEGEGQAQPLGFGADLRQQRLQIDVLIAQIGQHDPVAAAPQRSQRRALRTVVRHRTRNMHGPHAEPNQRSQPKHLDQRGWIIRPNPVAQCRAQVEQRIEQLCLRYEAEKPYLISRWRWPEAASRNGLIRKSWPPARSPT